jgi:hypothetical protein
MSLALMPVAIAMQSARPAPAPVPKVARGARPKDLSPPRRPAEAAAPSQQAAPRPLEEEDAERWDGMS